MSTDRQRLQAAIQRIAKQDPELSELIGASKNRGGQASSTGVGISDSDRDRLCCDGSDGGNSNAGADQRDPSDSAKDGLDPDDPADISDNLSGVVDCETGQPICFEGGDFIPPEGWEDAQSPPIDPSYAEGFYWRVSNASNSIVAEAATLSAAINKVGGRPDCINCFNSTSYEIFKPANPTSLTCATGAPYECGGQGYMGGTAFLSEQIGCNGSAEPYCNPSESDIAIDDWPEDGCVNLSIKGGSIVGSKYDPENDGSYSAPRQEIELCDPEAGDSILVRADTDGTWKSIKSLDGDIDPDTQSGFLYDTTTGRRIRQISPSEFRDNTV